jgi:hypothetical protein
MTNNPFCPFVSKAELTFLSGISRNCDLKYRYIKMKEKVSSQELLRLETIFTFARDRNSISVMREQVENYERLVKEQAEKIEQEKLDARN